MRLVVAGTRSISNPGAELEKALESPTLFLSGIEVRNVDAVLVGGFGAVDDAAELWAKSQNIPAFKPSLPQAFWFINGPLARIKVNSQLAQMGTHLLALWDGKSPGTRDMISWAKKAGLKVHVWEVK